MSYLVSRLHSDWSASQSRHVCYTLYYIYIYYDDFSLRKSLDMNLCLVVSVFFVFYVPLYSSPFRRFKNLQVPLNRETDHFTPPSLLNVHIRESTLLFLLQVVRTSFHLWIYFNRIPATSDLVYHVASPLNGNCPRDSDVLVVLCIFFLNSIYIGIAL